MVKTIAISGNCPECNSQVLFKKTPYVGQPAYCDKCDTKLEVSQTDPLELEWLVGSGFMESNDQRFTKRRARPKQGKGKEKNSDPKRSRGKKPRKRRPADDYWEKENGGTRSRKRRTVSPRTPATPVSEEWDWEWEDKG